MDLARPPGTRIAAAAITLLFSLGVADQLKTPALPAPATAATSVEEIADRLRRHLDDDATRAPYVTPPSAPLLGWCRPQGVETRTPPEGVPAYSGELLLPELEKPMRVRFWLTSPEAAAGAATTARRGSGECDRPGRDALQDVASFDRLGWRGVRVMVAMDAWDDGEPGAVATIVAARGGLLAEVTWAWPFEVSAGPGWQVLLQGTASATSVLGAVGGDPAGPAPATATRSASARIAAALPSASSYGEDMTLWPAPGSGPRSHERVCGDPPHEQNAHAGAPAVTRRLIGGVSVREDVLFLPDEHSAERERAGPLGWDGSCSSDEDEPSYSVDPRLDPFTSGPWTGQIRTFAVRHPEPPPRPKGAFRRSVAHVAVGVRHGTTVVHLRWQGPAGTDPAAALRTGRTALMRTLARLPAEG
ncbi:hypothetical protein ACIBI7_30250 [Nonomuraea fuscirosea]|uniref:hypothetical protein n=1 Tax=Nonomuraea fuscirosea TaxID=1291556 RepID=UPI0037895AED